ncbi:hypothetical protein GGF42_008066, partial [Coemansia sp. RSA 2424]
MSEQSRYDAVGYPKSTRVSHGLRKQQSAATLRSAPSSYHQSPPLPLFPSPPQVAAVAAEPHSRLKGFEMRVINTHSGTAVVRAPILIEPVASGSRKGRRDEVPVLPPPSAAELRYNAQRALISTTAVLRSTVGSKAAGRQHATIGVKVGGTGGRRSRRITRTMSDQMHAMQLPPPVTTAAKDDVARPSGGFHISMQFSSEDKKQLRQRCAQQSSATASATATAVGDSGGYAGLEQGRASSSSMLELWGISTMRGADGTEHGSEEGDSYGESCADGGAAERATRQRAVQLVSGEGPPAQSPRTTTM